MSHIWMCHIICVHGCVCVREEGEWVWALDEWVMSHINESCHVHEFVTSQVYLSVYTWEGRVSGFECSMSHVTHQWVMSHIWICHITGVHECVCVTGKGTWVWVLDELVMSIVMSHIWICHITHRSNPLAPPLSHQDWGGKWVCSLAHTLICWFDRTPSNMWHVAWIYVTWCIHIWNMKYFPPTLRQQYRERPSGFVRSLTHHAYMNVSLQVYMSLYAWEGGGDGFECFLTHHTYKYRHIYSYK